MHNRCAAYFAAMESQPEPPPEQPETGFSEWMVIALCGVWLFIGYAAALANR